MTAIKNASGNTSIVINMWQIHYTHHTKHTSCESSRSENARILRDLKKCKFKIGTNGTPIRGQFENDPTRIRAWKRQTATRLFAEVEKSHRRDAFRMQKHSNSYCYSQLLLPSGTLLSATLSYSTLSYYSLSYSTVSYFIAWMSKSSYSGSFPTKLP